MVSGSNIEQRGVKVDDVAVKYSIKAELASLNRGSDQVTSHWTCHKVEPQQCPRLLIREDPGEGPIK